MAFKLFVPEHHHLSKPHISVSKGNTLFFSRRAAELIHSPHYMKMSLDVEYQLLRFEPAKKDERGAFSVGSGKYTSACNRSVIHAIKTLGQFDEARKFAVNEKDGGLVVNLKSSM
ncbi:hypothetical protein GPK34_00110 [Secundilactobacillus kimchicus]|uniref:hypothetical protein n=1 Tax=Secundilactobacillus kimchicus TaxID=528209 RepID=UPI001C028BE0|nr:hypothetical protein [Secundilactobacillus kimchicus]MBT9670439.1 hypothetical protein [Secundilactobacillus kimchicus]